MEPKEMEARLRALEVWANREAMRRGTLGFFAERFFSEQLAAMDAAEADAILAELANPYSFNLSVNPAMSKNEALRRKIADAATHEIEDVVESLRKRSTQLRAKRSADRVPPRA